jgi:hemerythrin-like domain-containing protein
VFAALYQEHIALEESLIYPEARRQMAADSARQP